MSETQAHESGPQDEDLRKLGFEGEQAITAELYAKHGKSYAARQVIIREGDFGREVYLIISGRD